MELLFFKKISGKYSEKTTALSKKNINLRNDLF